MQNTLVIVTDLGLFKAYRLERTPVQHTPRLELLEELEVVGAHGRFEDKVTDQAGRWRVPTLRIAMSYGERQKIDLETRKRLIKQLAEHISRVVHEHRPEECYLSVNKAVQRQLLDELGKGVREKVTKVVAADLTKMDTAALLDHFAVSA